METTRYWPEWRFESYREEVTNLMKQAGVRPKDVDDFVALMEPLRVKSKDHWEHTIRVGALANAMGYFMGLDSRALLLAGFGHDIGKALVANSTLGKVANWTPQDAETMKTHVPDGWRLLRDRFDFTAEIMAWHHRFQPNCYPSEALSLLQPHDVGTSVVIPFYGRILALADTFDALHRQNPKKLSGREIEAALRKSAPDLFTLIDRFYEANILEYWEHVQGIEEE